MEPSSAAIIVYLLFCAVQSSAAIIVYLLPCTGCQRSIGLCNGKAKVCSYSGRYYCSSCHVDDSFLIPARVVHNWDTSRYKVGAARACAWQWSHFAVQPDPKPTVPLCPAPITPNCAIRFYLMSYTSHDFKAFLLWFLLIWKYMYIFWSICLSSIRFYL